MTDVLRLAVAQSAPILRDIAANATHIASMTARIDADLIVTPELSLTGYDVGDAVHSLARPIVVGESLPLVAASNTAVVFGTIEAAAGGPFNSAAVVQDGVVRFRHRKLYLPTYGMFDEARWFGRGTTLDTFTTRGGWHIGVLICEDFWHPGLSYVLAARGIDVLIVPAAAAGRGVWNGGEYGAFASADIWERMVRTTAQLYGIYVALANRVGVEGGITFAGGSVIAAPDGTVLARAGDMNEDVAVVEASRRALRRARTPYTHARDDDAALVLRELQRALAGP